MHTYMPQQHTINLSAQEEIVCCPIKNDHTVYIEESIMDFETSQANQVPINGVL